MGAPEGRAEAGNASVQPRAAELEELPGQQLLPRRRSRIGLGGALATAALVALLAGGLGLLGGRPEASVAPSAAAVASTPSSPSSIDPPGTPAVTPWMECGPDPVEVPDIKLESNGVPTEGLVEPAVDPQPARTYPPGNPFASIRGPRVTVRPDVVTELWIDGGACALDWSIELIDVVTEEAWVLDAAHNARADPAYAAQNRFNVSADMGRHRSIGHDVQFGGVFVFRTMVVRAFWRLRIQPLDPPAPSLVSGSSAAPIALIEGCDVRLRLGNGFEERRRTCAGDLSLPPEDWRPVRVGDMLDLTFDGWTPQSLFVICGRLSGLAFIAEPLPGCWLEPPTGTPFQVPDLPGRWTLALSACASQDGSNAANQVCGTWYANVEIVEGPVPGPTLAVS